MDTLQAVILRAMLSKRGWSACSDIIRADLVGNSGVVCLLQIIRELHAKTEGDLSTTDVGLQVSSVYQGERAEELLEMLSAVAAAEVVNEETLEESARRWASREYLSRAARYIAQNLGSDALDAEVALNLCQKSADVAEGGSAGLVSYDETGLPGEADDRPGLTSVGLSPDLDAALNGGIADGELCVLLAPPARGKTSYLCKIGAEAARRGLNVLHITLEISTARVVRRYDSALTGLTRMEMLESPRVVGTARKAVAAAGGGVEFQDWSYRDVCPADISGLVKGLRARGGKVDMVIIDYLELLEPNKAAGMSRREQRHVFGQLGKQVRALSVKLNVPVVTAWQVNREGSDSHNVELRHVSECWDIIKHADQIISLNQTDAERDERVMRIRVLKQRDSTDRSTVYLKSDLDRMIVKQLREEENAV